MGPGPVLILAPFAANRLTSIYESQTEDDFNTAFNELFASNAKVILNGKHISRDAYKQQVWKQIEGVTDPTVNVAGVLQTAAPEADKHLVSLCLVQRGTSEVKEAGALIFICL